MKKQNGGDCCICGSKGTVFFKENVTETLIMKNKSISVDGLSGNFCIACEDGFWDDDSEKKITSIIKQTINK